MVADHCDSVSELQQLWYDLLKGNPIFSFFLPNKIPFVNTILFSALREETKKKLFSTSLLSAQTRKVGITC